MRYLRLARELKKSSANLDLFSGAGSTTTPPRSHNLYIDAFTIAPLGLAKTRSGYQGFHPWLLTVAPLGLAETRSGYQGSTLAIGRRPVGQRREGFSKAICGCLAGLFERRNFGA